jgi:hypothetical protein
MWEIRITAQESAFLRGWESKFLREMPALKKTSVSGFREKEHEQE